MIVVDLDLLKKLERLTPGDRRVVAAYIDLLIARQKEQGQRNDGQLAAIRFN